METSFSFKAAEVQLIYKSKVSPWERPKIESSRSAHDVIKNFINLDEQEHIERVYVMLLNKSNKVLGISKVSDGGVSGCLVDPKVVFQYALKANASGLILWHNHPSGNLTASEADKALTKKLQDAGKTLDISFLDHIIIDSFGGYLSLADEGII